MMMMMRCRPAFKAKMHQIRFRLGHRPRPRWGSSQRSPRPPSQLDLRGSTSRGVRVGRGGNGKGTKRERRGKGAVEGREEKEEMNGGREGPTIISDTSPVYVFQEYACTNDQRRTQNAAGAQTLLRTKFVFYAIKFLTQAYIYKTASPSIVKRDP